MESKFWCWSLNNYVNKDLHDIYETLEGSDNPISYIVFGKEVGEETGTKHLQGYCEFKMKKRRTGVSKLFPKCFLDNRHGTAEEASMYCKKGIQPKDEWTTSKWNGPTFGKDAKVFEWGELSKADQGKRNDMVEIKNSIKNGMKWKELSELFPGQCIRYTKGIKEMLNTFSEHRTEAPYCVWLHGLAGVGKSFYPNNKHGQKDIFVKNEGKWWDTYEGEEAVLIDDFEASDWSYRPLLRLLDENKYVGETKGSSFKLSCKFIYITCEFPPEKFWSDNKLEQILGRFDEIIEVTGENKRTAPIRRKITSEKKVTFDENVKS